MSEGIGNPLDGLVQMSIWEAEKIVKEIDEILKTPDEEYTVKREHLARMQFGVTSATLLMSKLYDANKQIFKELQDLAEKYHRATEI